MSRVNRSHGFTIVELMLAMTFVSLLLVAITVTVIQIANIYTKGTTMRAVNQAGQTLVDDMRRGIEAARPLDLGTTTNGGQNFRPMTVVGGDATNPDGGRLCTGSYSYIWNDGKAFTNPVNKYTGNNTLIHMVKVTDNGSLYCADPTKTIDPNTAIELLSGGDRELAIQSFTIQQVAADPQAGQALYYMTLEVGTNDQTALTHATSLTSIDTSCRPPVEGQKIAEYCAVNKFEFTARAGNAGGAR